MVTALPELVCLPPTVLHVNMQSMCLHIFVCLKFLCKLLYFSREKKFFLYLVIHFLMLFFIYEKILNKINTISLHIFDINI